MCSGAVIHRALWWHMSDILQRSCQLHFLEVSFIVFRGFYKFLAKITMKALVHGKWFTGNNWETFFSLFFSLENMSWVVVPTGFGTIVLTKKMLNRVKITNQFQTILKETILKKLEKVKIPDQNYNLFFQTLSWFDLIFWDCLRKLKN